MSPKVSKPSPTRLGFVFLENQLAQLLLRINVIRIHHRVRDVAVTKGNLDQANVFCLLIELDREGVPKRVQFFRNRPVQLPDLIKSVIRNWKKSCSAGVLREPLELIEKTRLERNLAIIRALNPADINRLVIRVQILNLQI